MPIPIPRIAYLNRIRERTTLLFASSQQNSLPVGFLRDQLPSKVWRSQVGFTFTADNNKINFKEGANARTGTVTLGTYGNGADAAVAIQTAMNTAPGAVNTYTVTYDPTTFKFTIARATGAAALELSWATGADAAVSVGKDLGFDVNTDDTGFTTYTGDLVAYQSRHWIRADLGSAMASQVAIVFGHNAGTGGTFTQQAAGSDSWGLPNLNTTLAGDADIRLAFFNTQTRRWWRLIIDDVQNSLGYSEVGIWFAGPYTQPSVTYSQNLVNDPEELSALGIGIRGSHFVDERPIRQVWSLQWLEAPEADRILLEAVRDGTPKGRNFFLAFDAVDDPVDTLYGFRAGSMRTEYVPGFYWTISFVFAEALD